MRIVYAAIASADADVFYAVGLPNSQGQHTCWCHKVLFALTRGRRRGNGAEESSPYIGVRALKILRSNAPEKVAPIPSKTVCRSQWLR